MSEPAFKEAPAARMGPGGNRREFLGGSDIAAVIGLSPWATPVELWMEKTGRTPVVEPDEQRKRMFARGHKLEPFIRDMVIEKLSGMGVEVELLDVSRHYTDTEHQFLRCEIDFELRLTGTVEIGGLFYDLDGEHINADAKSVSGFARKKWGETDTEDVPIEYAAQFMHGLGITGRRICLVAALRSFDDVDIFWTLRDDETIKGMREKAVLFWNECVLADVAPDPFTFTDIKLLFPMDNGQSIEATDDIYDKVQKLRDTRERIRGLEDLAEELTFQIGDFISPNAVLTYGTKPIATWKGQGRNDFDEKRFKEEHPALALKYSHHGITRVLRLKK